MKEGKGVERRDRGRNAGWQHRNVKRWSPGCKEKPSHERLVSVAGRVLTSGLGRAFLHEPCVLSRSVMSDSVQPHGLWPARLLCPRDPPGKNTGVGCRALLQGVFPTQGSNLVFCVSFVPRVFFMC